MDNRLPRKAKDYRYMIQIQWFLRYLRTYRNYLTKQQMNTLRGQALKGDFQAVRKGLVTILRRQGLNVNLGR